MFELGMAIGLISYLVFLVYRSCFRIEQGYLGVVTTFGRVVVDEKDETRLRLFESGLHFKWPWQKVHRVGVMEQNLDMSGERGGRMAMAEDGTVLRFDSILRFVPDREQLFAFLFGMKAPLEHITGLFTCLLRNEIANFRGESKDDEGSYALIRRERKHLNRRIEAFCRDQVGGRYGVVFNAVDLTDILPPDELADALNAVINSKSEADETYARAEAYCQRQLLAAQRGVEIAKARAFAAEREILTLADHLQELNRQGTLHLYVSRRRSEVLTQARTLFLRSPS